MQFHFLAGHRENSGHWVKVGSGYYWPSEAINKYITGADCKSWGAVYGNRSSEVAKYVSSRCTIVSSGDEPSGSIIKDKIPQPTCNCLVRPIQEADKRQTGE